MDQLGALSQTKVKVTDGENRDTVQGYVGNIYSGLVQPRGLHTIDTVTVFVVPRALMATRKGSGPKRDGASAEVS